MEDLFFTLADTYQLGAIAWRFPVVELARGLLDGSFSADLSACLQELGYPRQSAEEISAELGTAAAVEAEGSVQTLYDALRTAYTALFLVPKKEKVYLYESLFRYPKNADPKNYSMFVSPCALHCEQLYREAGLAVKKNVREPADHFATELEFYSCLNRMAGANPEQTEWPRRAETFRKTHLDKWQKAFLAEVEEKSPSETYRILAKAGGMIADAPGLQRSCQAESLPEQ